MRILLAASVIAIVCLSIGLLFPPPVAAYADEENDAASAVDKFLSSPATKEGSLQEADEDDEADKAKEAGETEEEVSPDYSKMTLKELKKAVEAKTAERDQLRAKLEQLAEQLAETSMLLEETTAELVGQQVVAEHSVRERYKVQRQYPTLIDALLCAQDWQSFIAGVEYIEAASEASVDEVADLRQEVEEYEREKARLETDQATTDKKLEQVSKELEKVTAARDEAQRKADMVANAHLNPDGADWDADKDEFVEEWASRIDDYLDGTPMEGQGEAFAKAAWKNHIDPRFSPAISFIESSNGRICIRPYNAWGWGAADSDPYGLALEWTSWEEAINAHVRGLKAGYGYTVTAKGAKKYCPPNWELWYATTVDQMNRI